MSFPAGRKGHELGGEDSLATADEVAEVRKLILDIANIHLIESTCCFFAIPGDEWHCPAFIQQRNGRDERAQRYVEQFDDMKKNFRAQGLSLIRALSPS